jgi:integrase
VIVALLYDAGLRAGELCVLDVNHLYLKNGCLSPEYYPERLTTASDSRAQV